MVLRLRTGFSCSGNRFGGLSATKYNMGKRKATPVANEAELQQSNAGERKAAKQPKLATEASGFKNKEKVLLLSSRGITHRSALSCS